MSASYITVVSRISLISNDWRHKKHEKVPQIYPVLLYVRDANRRVMIQTASLKFLRVDKKLLESKKNYTTLQ